MTLVEEGFDGRTTRRKREEDDDQLLVFVWKQKLTYWRFESIRNWTICLAAEAKQISSGGAGTVRYARPSYHSPILSLLLLRFQYPVRIFLPSSNLSPFLPFLPFFIPCPESDNDEQTERIKRNDQNTTSGIYTKLAADAAKGHRVRLPWLWIHGVQARGRWFPNASLRIAVLSTVALGVVFYEKGGEKNSRKWRCFWLHWFLIGLACNHQRWSMNILAGRMGGHWWWIVNDIRGHWPTRGGMVWLRWERGKGGDHQGSGVGDH